MNKISRLDISKPDLKHLKRKYFFEAVQRNDELDVAAASDPGSVFLCGPTQQVYLRQIKLISHIGQLMKQKDDEPLSFLDWGAGRGHNTFLLGKEGISTVPFDVHFHESPIWPLTSQKKPTLGTDPYRLPYDDNTFDIISSFGVLEHVPQEKDSLQELYRVLKHGGLLLILFLPYYLSYTQRIAHLFGNYYHDRLYSKRNIKDSLTKQGYEILDIGHGQLFPKNRAPSFLNKFDLESVDRMLTEFTPLKYFATNLEILAIKT